MSKSLQDQNGSFLILLASSQQISTTYTMVVCTVKNSWWRTEDCSVLILLASSQQISMTYTFAVCTVKNSWWRTEDCPKRVEFYSKNKFEKLAHLVGIIIRTNDLSFSRHLCVSFLNTPTFREAKRNLHNINLHSKHNNSCSKCCIRLLRAKTDNRQLHIESECCFLEMEIALKLHRCSFFKDDYNSCYYYYRINYLS